MHIIYLFHCLSKLLKLRADRKRLRDTDDQLSGFISSCARWVLEEFSVLLVVAFRRGNQCVPRHDGDPLQPATSEASRWFFRVQSTVSNVMLL